MIKVNKKITSYLTQKEIITICSIKKQYWKHDMKSQLSWWKENSNKNDIFITLIKSKEIIAFLRLRKRKVNFENSYNKAFCVTEVCVDKNHRGKGLGKILMQTATEFIHNSSLNIGYLLCEKKEMFFYKKCGWKKNINIVIKSEIGKKRILKDNEVCMIFDQNKIIKNRITIYGDVF